MEPIIQIDHVTKTYNLYDRPIDRLKEALSITQKPYHREHHSLNDVTFSVEKGESLGIVGTNGAGKSTLLKVITGVLKPTQGEVTVRGKIAALLELGAGFNMEYTGIENIYLNGTMMGFKRAEVKEKVPDIVKFADIGGFIDQPVKTYSSGMFARLAFAVAINVEPDVLIVDEALSVGDTRFQIKCIDKMKELKEKGTTILFVSHATEQIKRFCTRTIWLDQGKIKKDGEASQIVDLYDNYMKFGWEEEEILLDEQTKGIEEKYTESLEEVTDKSEFAEEETKRTLVAAIKKVTLGKNIYHTFEPFHVEVEYEIFEDTIQGFLLGVAIYSADRKEYIFGPNTYLEKVTIPNTQGSHKVIYEIKELPLISGAYVIDVGIFNNEGIVNLDYRMSAKGFSVSNSYFSEGMIYMKHNWKTEY